MWRFIDLANLLTLLSLGSALACALLAWHQRLALAVVALIVSGLSDLFDGLVARSLNRTEEQRRFGARLDSLVDACAFGFAPALLLHAFGLTSPVDLLILFLIPVCAVWRLAYFDTVANPTEVPTYYTGMPTTYVALFLPLGVLCGIGWPAVQRWITCGTGLALALAMIAPVQVPKPRGIAYVVFLVLGLGSCIAFWFLGDDHVRPAQP